MGTYDLFLKYMETGSNSDLEKYGKKVAYGAGPWIVLGVIW